MRDTTLYWVNKHRSGTARTVFWFLRWNMVVSGVAAYLQCYACLAWVLLHWSGQVSQGHYKASEETHVPAKMNVNMGSEHLKFESDSS